MATWNNWSRSTRLSDSRTKDSCAYFAHWATRTRVSATKASKLKSRTATRSATAASSSPRSSTEETSLLNEWTGFAQIGNVVHLMAQPFGGTAEWLDKAKTKLIFRLSPTLPVETKCGKFVWHRQYPEEGVVVNCFSCIFEEPSKTREPAVYIPPDVLMWATPPIPFAFGVQPDVGYKRGWRRNRAIYGDVFIPPKKRKKNFEQMLAEAGRRTAPNWARFL